MAKITMQSITDGKSTITATRTVIGTLVFTRDDGSEFHIARDDEDGEYVFSIENPTEDYDPEVENYTTDMCSMKLPSAMAHMIFMFFREKFGP